MLILKVTHRSDKTLKEIEPVCSTNVPGMSFGRKQVKLFISKESFTANFPGLARKT